MIINSSYILKSNVIYASVHILEINCSYFVNYYFFFTMI